MCVCVFTWWPTIRGQDGALCLCTLILVYATIGFVQILADEYCSVCVCPVEVYVQSPDQQPGMCSCGRVLQKKYKLYHILFTTELYISHGRITTLA